MKKVVFGIDIGGTTVKCGLFYTDGTLVEKCEIPTRKEDGGARIIDDICAQIRQICSDRNILKENIIGIGMGVPGSVNKDGVVNKCVNLGWGVFNAAAEIERRMGISAKAGNDANMAALGEFWLGGAKGYSSMMMITVGTGVGGGIIIDGKPLVGFNGAAAEIGHIPVEDNETEKCNCGKSGCLEQYASATGIVRVAQKMLQEETMASVLRKIEKFTAKDIFDAAKSGDMLSVKVAEYVSRMLAKGLACAAGIIDPECFLIGGGVSAAGDYFINLIEKNYRELVFHPSRDTKILKAALGNDAGMCGAARLML
ncbi:MAG: ROK family glucokinase [Eubacteriales bacterium]|nr:ROK family glucokinase [Eubacteriales bacterium]